jgi:hypothetical protein
MLICTLVSGGMDVVCMLICAFVSGGMDVCIYVNTVCTLVSRGIHGCMYVNMYIGIWWYGRLYVC